MNIDLKGKNILVTGASRGIGKAIAEDLARAGARVAVHYNQSREAAVGLAGRLGHGAVPFQADLGDADACSRLVDEVLDIFGHLEVLVNNAGIFIHSPIENESWLKDWEMTMNVNLRATGILSRKAIMHFQSRGGGRIINISSRAAFRGDNAENLAYAASKAGMVALTKSIARAYGKDGITSFVIAPGWVRTDMSIHLLKEMGGEHIITDTLALNKLTEPKDVSPMVVFLASGKADHATGTTIDINAGSYVH